MGPGCVAVGSDRSTLAVSPAPRTRNGRHPANLLLPSWAESLSLRLPLPLSFCCPWFSLHVRRTCMFSLHTFSSWWPRPSQCRRSSPCPSTPCGPTKSHVLLVSCILPCVMSSPCLCLPHIPGPPYAHVFTCNALCMSIQAPITSHVLLGLLCSLHPMSSLVLSPSLPPQRTAGGQKHTSSG